MTYAANPMLTRWGISMIEAGEFRRSPSNTDWRRLKALFRPALTGVGDAERPQQSESGKRALSARISLKQLTGFRSPYREEGGCSFQRIPLRLEHAHATAQLS